MDPGDFGVLDPGALSPNRFNNPATRRTRLEYSDESSMTVSVHRVI
jgi:hypothetical protein